MRIVVAGATGAVGRCLVPALRKAGHDVRRLVRRAAAAADEIAWNPAAGEIDVAALGETEAFVNLAGENIAGGRWTAERREHILRSRVDATRTLVLAMAALPRRPGVFLSASAAGFYGNRGDSELSEESPIGQGFLPEVCLAWETHAQGAARRGIRTVMMRFGVVLTPSGGALGKMLPLFRLGLGGRLGSGRQWMSWIAIEDVVGAMLHCLGDARCAGPMNFVVPAAVTNGEFASTLGLVVGRPARTPVPGWVLRLVVGRMADEALLASTRVLPERLREVGYRFREPGLEGALRAVVG